MSDSSHHRQDIQGLRAIAVALVVAFHAGVAGIQGGFIGVDVFFVISGFVITGLLGREIDRSGRASILGFYGRRAQRVLPAACLVLIVTMVATYMALGFIAGGRTALDAQWASIFLSNIHFAAIGTDYLGSQLAPSPLQHYWSLAVEEQFYVVWPVLIWLVARGGGARSSAWRSRAVGVLIALVVASYTCSVVQTSTNGSWAYFSPLTRACELGAGALVALTASTFRSWSPALRSAVSICGFVVIVVCATTFTETMGFPGWAVALPVLGTSAMLAAGTGVASYGAVSAVLGSRPFVALGNISFSLYLWHWPLLTIPEQRFGRPLTGLESAVAVLLALALSVLSYAAVENPLRRAGVLKRKPWVSVGLGVVLIGAVFAVSITELYSHPY